MVGPQSKVGVVNFTDSTNSCSENVKNVHPKERRIFN